MKKTSYLAKASLIAAIYVILTYIANSLGLSNGVIQIRFSEALTILPVFTKAAVPGLFAGCMISNLLTGSAIWDIIFGSFATLLGALGTYLLKSKAKWLSPIPPIIANTLIIPFILSYVYKFEGSILYFVFTVGIGEIISCGFLGIILQFILIKRNIKKL